MSFGECKVYFDGSHYIAIPHTTRPPKKRPKLVEELIKVDEETNEVIKDPPLSEDNSGEVLEIKETNTDSPLDVEIKQPKKAQKTRTVTRKELFEEFYKEAQNLNKYRRKSFVIEKMTPYFDNEEQAKNFVMANWDRKWRNTTSRRVRMTRKANLQYFNYFCTFTYSNEKHTEDTFKMQLKSILSTFSKRKGWKYIGVWERSPEKHRLHFHGVFYIPDTSILGSKYERRDFSFAKQDMITTYTFPYFENKLGRADFEPIEDAFGICSALAYLIKYIEKTGERIVYSKGLPQFFISDIMDDDIVCPFGLENKKLILFDNFGCWDEGCYMGQVSPQTIELMRKAN